MAAEIVEDNDGLPWLSWARSGMMALAGVLIVGLVISARNLRLQSAAGPNASDGLNAPVPNQASADSRPGGPVPAGSSSSSVGRVATVVANPAIPKETSSVAAPAPLAISESAAMPQRSAVPSPIVPISPPAPVQANVQPTSPAPSPLPSPAAVAVAPDAATQNPGKQDAAKQDPAVQDPIKRAAFVRAAADVRAAMGKRSLDASKRDLKTVAANVQTAADQAELERLQALQDHLEQFWNGVRQAVAKMQPVDEIVMSESDRVAVIEASSTELSVQWEGWPQRWRIEAIPMDLLSAIAKSSFEPTPGSKLIVGSFLAMDGLGNRAEAARLWQEAIRGGESEGKLLLPELDASHAGQRKP